MYWVAVAVIGFLEVAQVSDVGQAALPFGITMAEPGVAELTPQLIETELEVRSVRYGARTRTTELAASAVRIDPTMTPTRTTTATKAPPSHFLWRIKLPRPSPVWSPSHPSCPDVQQDTVVL